MSEARITNLSNESNTGGPTISGITTFSGTNYFVPPVGSTAERPENPEKGSIRFNTDSKHLEYFKGDTINWVDVEASNEELNGGYRGVFAVGRVGPASVNTIEYLNISTLGNATDFGDRTVSTRRFGAASSRTRGLLAGGYDGSGDSDVIDYITTASTGNAIDFGNLLGDARTIAGLSNATRGVFGGNEVPTQLNVIQYVTIAQTGNAVDFGDTTRVGHQATTCSSTTRGLFAAVYGSPGNSNVIDYITIATTGNAADFGDMVNTASGMYGGSNATRGVFAGGYNPDQNIIQYVTIATTGNTTDFGDLTAGRSSGCGCPTSPTRAVFAGGYGVSPHPKVNIIDYIEILTTGNAKDFGDLTTAASYGSAGSCSNGHGGL